MIKLDFKCSNCPKPRKTGPINIVALLFERVNMFVFFILGAGKVSVVGSFLQ